MQEFVDEYTRTMNNFDYIPKYRRDENGNPDPECAAALLQIQQVRKENSSF
jgi:hypothetical protein